MRLTPRYMYISIADVVRATEGDRDTVKRAEKSVDRDGSDGEGDGHGHRGAYYYVCGPADRHGARVTAHTSARRRRRRRQSAPADAFRVSLMIHERCI